MDLHNINHYRQQHWSHSASPPETIYAPKGHEGVGNALRSAYLPRASDLPHEMANLLEKLG